MPDASGTDAGPTIDAPTGVCAADRDCDDGVFCNGAETCSAGHCVARMLACDDGIACTIDDCNEGTRSCTSTAPDVDDDGFGDRRCLDAIGVPIGTDCDDADANTFPGNTEVCDDHDEDCIETTLGGLDEDHDGAVPDTCCNPSATGTPNCGRDCDDTNPSLSRLATEICDAVDNDCDSNIDEGATLESWPDFDMDGFGDASATPEIVCLVPTSRANEGGDCDDRDRRVHPHQTEDCNGVDDDCDAITDEGGDAACLEGVSGTTAQCLYGACVVTGCDADRFDCNGVGSDGCETALCGDVANCGRCGRMCGGGSFAACGGGHCSGSEAMAALLGMVTDLITGAPVSGALIESIGVCPGFSAMSAADGSFTFGPAVSFPSFVRITAPGYPVHVQPLGRPLTLLPSSLVDAWAADPDLATPRSATRAIVVVDVEGGTYAPIVHAGILGAANDATGTDLTGSSGDGPRDVYFGALPGHAAVGGSATFGGTCSQSCGADVALWLEPGTVTYVGPFSCGAFCP
jgi:hypothetical protein